MFHTFGWAAGNYGAPCFGGVGYGYYAGGHFWIMGLVALVIITSLTLSIIALVKASRNRSASGSDALRVLENRYAQGEISKEQYDTMKRDLR